MATGCSHPRANLKDLNTHVIPHIPADKWKDLGFELLDSETSAAELSHIKANNPEIRQRCEAMFEKWLLGRNATWNELIVALQKVGLMFLADNIEKTFISMTDMLPVEHTKSEANKNTHMISRADEASAEFGILLSKILEALIKNKCKSLQLLKSICSTLTIKNDSNISIFSDEELHKIMACDDIKDLFLVKLRNYWRWDDISVLSIVVSSLNSKKCESLLDQFSTKIDAKMKLIEVYKQCQRENDFPKGLNKMIAIIKKPFRSITKKEYSELKIFIADNCGVESYAISPFIKASYSSLRLEWYIPGAAVAYMAEIASFNKQHFIDHGFIYLKLTASVIFDQRDTVNVSKSKTTARFTSKKGMVDSPGEVIRIVDEKGTKLLIHGEALEEHTQKFEFVEGITFDDSNMEITEGLFGILFKLSSGSSSSSRVLLPVQSGTTGHHCDVGKETIVTKKSVKEQDYQTDS